MADPRRILFTAFEPSGDEHAAPVIAELKRRDPSLRLLALGGDRMARAGAERLALTTDSAAMGLGAVAKIREQQRYRALVKNLLDREPVDLLVPTDSPAANWAFCRLAKKRGASVVHLVAPQVWAWAEWRVKRLKKWSDRVLCLLPFEEAWFRARGIDARFIGHPLFLDPLPETRSLEEARALPDSGKKLVLLPGSRPGEIRKNWPLLLEVFQRLRRRHPDLAGAAVAAGEKQVSQLQAMTPHLPEGLTLLTGRLAAALHWGQAVLAVSGTVTLHVVRQQVPMVTLYQVSPITWHGIARWLMNTRTFTLPNLLAAGGPTRDRSKHLVPEFAPFLEGPAGVQPVADAVEKLLTDEETRSRQIAGMQKILAGFHGHHAAAEAADALLEVLNRK